MKYKKETSSLEELGTNKCLELFKIAKEYNIVSTWCKMRNMETMFNFINCVTTPTKVYIVENKRHK